MFVEKTVVCQTLEDEAGMAWHAVCFVFVLVMIRICKSWYFQHVMDELGLDKKLAAM